MTLDQATDKIYEAVQRLGPQATDLAMTTARVSALSHIMVGFILAGIEGALIWFLLKHGKAWWDDDYEPVVIAASVLAMFVLIPMACFLIDPFDWIGLFRPDIYLAHQFVK